MLSSRGSAAKCGKPSLGNQRFGWQHLIFDNLEFRIDDSIGPVALKTTRWQSCLEGSSPLCRLIWGLWDVSRRCNVSLHQSVAKQAGADGPKSIQERGTSGPEPSPRGEWSGKAKSGFVTLGYAEESARTRESQKREKAHKFYWSFRNDLDGYNPRRELAKGQTRESVRRCDERDWDSYLTPDTGGGGPRARHSRNWRKATTWRGQRFHVLDKATEKQI